MVRFHKSRGAVCTVALSTGVRIEYGVGKVDVDGRINYFAEKPVLPDYPVSIGVYVCEPSFLQYLSLGTDLAADILPQLLVKGAKFYGFLTPETHHDIGSFKQLDEAKKILKPQKGRTK
jgi:NDP-sugar pyrophosphorylase family protein